MRVFKSSGLLKALILVLLSSGLTGCLEDASIKKSLTRATAKISAAIGIGVDTNLPVDESGYTFEYCSEKEVILYDGDKIYRFKNIQSAVSNAPEDSSIFVPEGDWNEFVRVSNKEKLTIESKCNARVAGFQVTNSEDLVISGFEVTEFSNVIKSGKNQIKDQGKNQIKDHGKNQIKDHGKKANAKTDGFEIRGKNRNLTLKKNYVHHKNGSGISIQGSSQDTISTIQENVIVYNTNDGIEVSGSPTLDVIDNTIHSNGGYGIAVRNHVEPGQILLTNNTVTLNNGKENKSSSQDLLNYEIVLQVDETRVSSGNQTTSGTEGTGISIISDAKPPTVTFVTPDDVATSSNTYTVKYIVSDVSPVTATIFVNDTVVATDQDLINAVTIPLVEGTNTVKVVATDSYSNTSTTQQTITLDTVPPVLNHFSSSQIFANSFPVTTEVELRSNEILTSATVNQIEMIVSGGSALASVQVPAAGPFQLQYQASDRAGNVATLNKEIVAVFDNVAPVVNTTLQDGAIVEIGSISIPLTITDIAPTSTSIYLNDSLVFVTGSKQFGFSINLPDIGESEIKIVSTDSAGNTSEPILRRVVREPPFELTVITPVDGGTIEAGYYEVRIETSKPMVLAAVQSKPMKISGDKKAATSTLERVVTGPTAIQVHVKSEMGTEIVRNIPFSIAIVPLTAWSYQECSAQ